MSTDLLTFESYIKQYKLAITIFHNKFVHKMSLSHFESHTQLESP